MTRVLHILTQPEDELARLVLQGQAASQDLKIATVDLRLPNPDYDALLEKVFDADSIQVW